MNQDNPFLVSLKTMVRGTYDLQQVRQQTGQRLAANFRARLRPEGSAENASDEELGEEAMKIIDVLKASHKKLTEGIARNRTLPREEGFKGDEVISTFAELVLVNQFLTLQAHEDAQFRQMVSVLNHIPVYTEYLRDVIGVGPAMAAVLITYLDPAKARHASSFWKYAGLDVSGGRGRSRRAEHLVERQYINKDGKEATRMGVTYNPFLKTKLMGVLGGSFLRAASPWRKAYDDYKHRLVTDPSKKMVTLAEWKKAHTAWKRGEEAGDTTGLTDPWTLWSPGRVNTASVRYMVKMFLAELWAKWRALEGLPVTPTYHEAKQGHKHGGSVTPIVTKQRAKAAPKSRPARKRAAA